MRGCCDGVLTASAVKKALSEYREREKDIRHQTERLDLISDRLVSIGSPVITDMPKAPSPSNNRLDNILSLKIELEGEVKEMISLQNERRRTVEHILTFIQNSDEKAVIRARYLDCSVYYEDRLTDWSDVCNLLFGGRVDFLDKEHSYMVRTHKLHQSALQDIATVLTEHAEIRLI